MHKNIGVGIALVGHPTHSIGKFIFCLTAIAFGPSAIVKVSGRVAFGPSLVFWGRCVLGCQKVPRKVPPSFRQACSKVPPRRPRQSSTKATKLRGVSGFLHQARFRRRFKVWPIFHHGVSFLGADPVNRFPERFHQGFGKVAAVSTRDWAGCQERLRRKFDQGPGKVPPTKLSPNFSKFRGASGFGDSSVLGPPERFTRGVFRFLGPWAAKRFRGRFHQGSAKVAARLDHAPKSRQGSTKARPKFHQGSPSRKFDQGSTIPPGFHQGFTKVPARFHYSFSKFRGVSGFLSRSVLGCQKVPQKVLPTFQQCPAKFTSVPRRFHQGATKVLQVLWSGRAAKKVCGSHQGFTMVPPRFHWRCFMKVPHLSLRWLLFQKEFLLERCAVSPTVLYSCVPVLFSGQSYMSRWHVSPIHFQSAEGDPSCRCCWGILWVYSFCNFRPRLARHYLYVCSAYAEYIWYKRLKPSQKHITDDVTIARKFQSQSLTNIFVTHQLEMVGMLFARGSTRVFGYRQAWTKNNQNFQSSMWKVFGSVLLTGFRERLDFQPSMLEGISRVSKMHVSRMIQQISKQWKLVTSGWTFLPNTGKGCYSIWEQGHLTLTRAQWRAHCTPSTMLGKETSANRHKNHHSVPPSSQTNKLQLCSSTWKHCCISIAQTTRPTVLFIGGDLTPYQLELPASLSATRARLPTSDKRV